LTLCLVGSNSPVCRRRRHVQILPGKDTAIPRTGSRPASSFSVTERSRLAAPMPLFGRQSNTLSATNSNRNRGWRLCSVQLHASYQINKTFRSYARGHIFDNRYADLWTFSIRRYPQFANGGRGFHGSTFRQTGTAARLLRGLARQKPLKSIVKSRRLSQEAMDGENGPGAAPAPPI